MTIERGIPDIRNGKFFRVTFFKADGTERVLVGRSGVRRYVKGTGGARVLPPDRLTVWDVQRQDYRTIPLDRVTEIKAGGRLWRRKV